MESKDLKKLQEEIAFLSGQVAHLSAILEEKGLAKESKLKEIDEVQKGIERMRLMQDNLEAANTRYLEALRKREIQLEHLECDCKIYVLIFSFISLAIGAILQQKFAIISKVIDFLK